MSSVFGTTLLQQLPPPPQDIIGWPWTEANLENPIALPDGTPWPRISIVTPSFNQAAYLEETIRSVLLQGYPNLEYIVMDGGSTDGSIDIIKKYAPWLANWVSEPDKGQSDAINKGWARANGHLLAWLNSDDYYTPGALFQAAQAFNDAGPQAGLAYGMAHWLEEPNKQITRQVGRPFDLEEILTQARSAVAQPSAFARATVVQKIGGPVQDLHYSMDWDLWNRIAMCSQVVFVPRVWSCMRFWPGAKTSVIAQQAGFGPDMLRSVQRLYQQPDLPPHIRALKRKAIAAIAVRAAHGYANAGKYREMQSAFFLALIQHPWHTLRRARRSSLRLALGPLTYWSVKP